MISQYWPMPSSFLGAAVVGAVPAVALRAGPRAVSLGGQRGGVALGGLGDEQEAGGGGGVGAALGPAGAFLGEPVDGAGGLLGVAALDEAEGGPGGGVVVGGGGGAGGGEGEVVVARGELGGEVRPGGLAGVGVRDRSSRGGGGGGVAAEGLGRGVGAGGGGDREVAAGGGERGLGAGEGVGGERTGGRVGLVGEGAALVGGAAQPSWKRASPSKAFLPALATPAGSVFAAKRAFTARPVELASPGLPGL